MTRKCSHCGHNGHNSRTCPNRGVKLFGVRLTDGPIRKSASMGNLMHYSNLNNPSSPIETAESVAAADGYVSDGLVQASSSSNSRERKKGVTLHRMLCEDIVPRRNDLGYNCPKWKILEKLPFVYGFQSLFRENWTYFNQREAVYGVAWTEEEHRMFLLGLQKLGKGDWRGIARNFVITRTPTQVASHAQKYFIRQSNMTRRKRRSSLFDIIAEVDPNPEELPQEDYSTVTLVNSAVGEPPENEALPSLNSTFNQGHLIEPDNGAILPSQSTSDRECESVDSANSVDTEPPVSHGAGPVACGVPAVFPGFVAPFVPVPFPFWPSFRPTTSELPPNANLFKPRAEIPKAPMNIDEFTGMSQLSLSDSPGFIEPSALSLKLLDRPSRQSAFHTNPSLNNSSFNSNSNAIHVV